MEGENGGELLSSQDHREIQEERRRRKEAERQRGQERRQNQDDIQRDVERQRGQERRQNQDDTQRDVERQRGQERRQDQNEDQRERERQRDRQRRENQDEEQRERERERDRQRRLQLREQLPPLFRAAVFANDNHHAPERHNLGDMNVICKHESCRALHFQAEHGRLLHSCCHDGKSLAPPLSPYPDDLRELLTSDSDESKHFREHIRQYNSANSFASFGAKIESMPAGRGLIVSRSAEKFII